MDKASGDASKNNRFQTICNFAGIMCFLFALPIPMSFMHAFQGITRYCIFFIGILATIYSMRAREPLGFIVFPVIVIVFNPFKNILFTPYIPWRIISFTSSLLFFVAGNHLLKKSPYGIINEKEAGIIRTEYLKAEELHKEAEMERNKAKTEREIAEELKRRAHQEWEEAWAESRRRTNAMEEERQDPYQILGVHETDTAKSISEVYRKLVLIYHPDKNLGVSELSRKQKNDSLAKINLSYEWILKHHRN